MNLQIKERPILMNAAMVRATLEGRKTQTRRIVKPQCELTSGSGFSWKGFLYGAAFTYIETVRNFAVKACPYGKPGDHLWVRESCWIYGGWQPESDYCKRSFSAMGKKVAYQATDKKPTDGLTLHRDWRGTPSIHMPRWASRIQLEIFSVRVERLNDISESDAKAEGIDGPESAAAQTVGWCEKPRRAFQRLWESINGADSWEANPWVWVVEFKRVEQ